MKKVTLRKNTGITLVALVITIIVLLILAGVTINLTIGDGGIIKTAQQAGKNYVEAAEDEQTQLVEFWNETGEIIGTSTSSSNSSNSSSTTESTNNVSSSVNMITVANGETVPVPKGFYYVGGNLSTGVIISDNEADQYDGKTDKTAYSYTTSLQGNQFVWIPCSTSDYHKTSWGLQNAEWDTTTPDSELVQIEKYGGFYVARYEAGLASTISESTTSQKHTGSNEVYNFDGVPQSKAGIVPWDFIDWTHSKANAESMYNTNYVGSGLITGTQWDVILNTLIDKTSLTSSDMTHSGSWGNYKTNSISYTGRLAEVTYSSGWYLEKFGTSTTGTTTAYLSDTNAGQLLTTGASSATEQYHIFDLAGNLWEWTEEESYYNTDVQYQMARGGCIWDDYNSNFSACYRLGRSNVSRSELHFGFRVVLYLK